MRAIPRLFFVVLFNLGLMAPTLHGQFEVRNLSLGASSISVEGNYVIFLANEYVFGDLNNDGDSKDLVPFLYNFAENKFINTGVDGRIPEDAYSLSDTLFLFAERAEGGHHDYHAPKIDTEEIHFLGQDSYRGKVDGSLAAFPIREKWADQVLNGDGDMVDQVLHVYDATNDKITNLQKAIASSDYWISGNWVMFRVYEGGEGDGGQNCDLNLDGDRKDEVIHFYNHITGVVTNTYVAGTMGDKSHSIYEPIADSYAPILIYESSQNQDLNGDGDLTDIVLHILDYQSGVLTSLGYAVTRPISVDGDITAFSVIESTVDLNGDGDCDDYVVHLYDGSTVTNLPFCSLSSRALSTSSVGLIFR